MAETKGQRSIRNKPESKEMSINSNMYASIYRATLVPPASPTISSVIFRLSLSQPVVQPVAFVAACRSLSQPVVQPVYHKLLQPVAACRSLGPSVNSQPGSLAPPLLLIHLPKCVPYRDSIVRHL